MNIKQSLRLLSDSVDTYIYKDDLDNDGLDLWDSVLRLMKSSDDFISDVLVVASGYVQSGLVSSSSGNLTMNDDKVALSQSSELVKAVDALVASV